MMDHLKHDIQRNLKNIEKNIVFDKLPRKSTAFRRENENKNLRLKMHFIDAEIVFFFSSNLLRGLMAVRNAVLSDVGIFVLVRMASIDSLLDEMNRRPS